MRHSDSTSCRFCSGEQSRANTAQVALLGLHLPPNLRAPLLPSGEIRLNLGPVAEVVRDDGVDIDEAQRVIPVHDRLRGHPVLEGPDDQLQKDPRVADAEPAVRVFAKRRSLGLYLERHRCILPQCRL